MRGGANDQRCINDTDYFTQVEIANVAEDNLIRIDSGLPQTDAFGNPKKQQQCQDRESFRRWIQDQGKTFFPQNRQPFSPAQIVFLEGFQVGYHQTPVTPEIIASQQFPDPVRVQEQVQEMNAQIAQMRENREILEDLDQIMTPQTEPQIIPGLLTPEDEIEMSLSTLTLAPSQALAFVTAPAPQTFFPNFRRASFELE